MFRLSDFIGKEKEKGGKPQPPVRPAQPAPPSKAGAPPTPPPSKLSLTLSAHPPERAATAVSPATLETLYDQLLACVKALFEQARAHQPLELSRTRALVELLPETKTVQCETLLSLVNRHTEENYLYSHSVNVAILANHLGHCLGYADEPLRQLGLAGLLLDIGMAGESEQLVETPRKLTDAEWKAMAQHPHAAVQQLKDAQGLSREALDAIAAHHEREKGQGYPRGLETGTLTEFAKILAVCDVYDALTHPRSYRKQFSPAQAVKMLIDGVDDAFDRRVVKALVDELSLYPPGSRVRLNTNEIGRVERVHLDAPLRPIVQVSHDANAVSLPEPRRVDLLEQPFIYIKEVVSEDTP